MTEDSPYFVGDSDLVFLGMVAALASRFQMKRKGGTMGFLQSDSEAMAQVRQGLEAGARVSLDDVPEIYVEVRTDKATVARLLDAARSLAADDGYRSDSDDDEEEDDPG